MEYLKHNGILFFLDRPVELIAPTDDRPLSSNFEALKKRYEERYDIYLSSCDERIENDGNPEKAVRKILEKLK